MRLFIANPGWVLRKPREFLSDLLEAALQGMTSPEPDLQKLETVTAALVKLLSTQPNLCELVPATGYLSRIFGAMGGLDAKVVKSPVLVVAEMSRNTACVENLASSCPNCVAATKRGLLLRKDLVGVCCDAFSRIFAGHHDNLIKQVSFSIGCMHTWALGVKGWFTPPEAIFYYPPSAVLLFYTANLVFMSTVGRFFLPPT